MEKLNCCRCTHVQSYSSGSCYRTTNVVKRMIACNRSIGGYNIERYKPSLLHFDIVIHDNHICCHSNAYICFIHLILVDFPPFPYMLYTPMHNILFGGCFAGRVEGKCLYIISHAKREPADSTSQ